MQPRSKQSLLSLRAACEGKQTKRVLLCSWALLLGSYSSIELGGYPAIVVVVVVVVVVVIVVVVVVVVVVVIVAVVVVVVVVVVVIGVGLVVVVRRPPARRRVRASSSRLILEIPQLPRASADTTA